MRYACLLGLLLSACGKKPDAIAELAKAEGPVERQVGSGDWNQVRIGAKYYSGDAAQTPYGSATLDISGGGARIVMKSGAVLRFRGTPGQSSISVERGTIDLTGTGGYSLDVGDVKLSPNGTVRIAATGGGRSSVTLTVGKAQLAGDGELFDLVLNTPVDVGNGAKVPRDAGVRDARSAPADAAVDAAQDAGPETVGDATIEVTGKRAELLAPGETAWTPLAPGAGQLARGSSVRLGAATTARLVANGTTLDLAGGARVTLGDDLALSLELGTSKAATTVAATIALPGGAVALAGEPGAPAEARIDGNARETKVAMLRGGSKLTGAAGASLAMSRGESASLARNGTIRVVEAIPQFFDLRVVAGESLTIHDPKPPTAVQFQFDGKCPDGGIIEVDRDGRFRTARVSSGRDFANVMVGGSGWAYRLRCTTNGAEGGPVASGRVAAIRDDGRRPLPKNPGVNDIDADGRNYTISYQSAIPSVAVHVKNPGAMHKLHLASAGKEQTFDSTTSTITVPGGQLREGTYTYWIDRDGVKQAKVSTLTIDFDQTAPQVYLESPINGQPWTGDIDVRGAVLPGWSAAVEAIAIPIDKQRRFAVKVGIPGGNALAVRLSHPQRGVHYYLRRPK